MDLIQFGTEVVVGLADYEFTGTIADSGDYKESVEDVVIHDNSMVPTTHMLHTKKYEITITGIIKASGYTAPSVGDVVTINSIEAPVLDFSVKPDRLAHKVTLRVLAYDGIDYSP